MLSLMKNQGTGIAHNLDASFENTRNLLVPRVLFSIEKNLSEEMVVCCRF